VYTDLCACRERESADVARGLHTPSLYYHTYYYYILRGTATPSPVMVYKICLNFFFKRGRTVVRRCVIIIRGNFAYSVYSVRTYSFRMDRWRDFIRRNRQTNTIVGNITIIRVSSDRQYSITRGIFLKRRSGDFACSFDFRSFNFFFLYFIKQSVQNIMQLVIKRILLLLFNIKWLEKKPSTGEFNWHFCDHKFKNNL